jgi:hypothetical protein
MVKKLLVGVLVLGMVAAIVAGIVELVTPSEHAYAQQERGAGQAIAGQARGSQQGGGGRYQQQVIPNTDNGTTGSTGYGRGRQNPGEETERDVPGTGRGQNRQEPQPAEIALETIEGMVVETDELLVETAGGERVQVGLGPSNYRDSQGFVLTVGDSVRVSGYWESLEADEFKALQVENLSTDTQIVLRDTSGRPMWAGQGRRSNQNNASF